MQCCHRHECHSSDEVNSQPLQVESRPNQELRCLHTQHCCARQGLPSWQLRGMQYSILGPPVAPYQTAPVPYSTLSLTCIAVEPLPACKTCAISLHLCSTWPAGAHRGIGAAVRCVCLRVTETARTRSSNPTVEQKQQSVNHSHGAMTFQRRGAKDNAAVAECPLPCLHCRCVTHNAVVVDYTMQYAAASNVEQHMPC